MNNKGQTLVLFVIFLPILVILGAIVIDVGRFAYETNRVNSINRMCIKYAYKNIDNLDIEKVYDLIEDNDSNINKYLLVVNDDKTQIDMSITKDVRGIFSSILDKDIYRVKSNYIGRVINNKL
ncbi:MAG TPA: pilus assembly protein, partial [Bacilli bacterium]|nr:pilus assembly protein [Bacilli bacterium]